MTLIASTADNVTILAIYDEQEASTSTSSQPTTSSLTSSLRNSSRTSERSADSAAHVLSVNTEERGSSRRRQHDKRYTVEVTDLNLIPASSLLVVPQSEVPPTQHYKKRPAPRPPSHSVSPPPLRNGALSRSGESRKSSLGAYLAGGLLIQEEYARSHTPSSSAAEEDGKMEDVLVRIGGGYSGSSLGIQVKPIYNDKSKLDGVEVTQIVEGGRAFEDGQLRLGDLITEISQRPLYQMSFTRAQTYLHEVGASDGPVELRLRRRCRPGETPPAPLPGPVGAGLPVYAGPEATLQKANTKRIGDKLTIQLTKQRDGGLGFSVTSRDTPTSSERQFFIKSILPRGAAVTDGRLAIGDRLLEVNGEVLSGLSQDELVDRLRGFKEGDAVTLLVSRMPDKGSKAEEKGEAEPGTQAVAEIRRLSLRDSPPPALSPLPRPLKDTTLELDEAPCGREFELDIPLNSSGCAGLGVSVKGRMVSGPVSAAPGAAASPPRDCGIFVKAIIHGGAAHKDGRLQVNDQLLAVNGTELAGVSNEEAITLITKSYARLHPGATSIRLKVCRHTGPAPRSEPPVTELYAEIRKGSTIASGSAEPTEVLVEDATDGQLYTQVVSRSSRDWDEESSVVGGGGEEAFDRDAPVRKSLSEKRGLKASNTPAHILTYQKIRHQRQASAPALDRVDDSTPMRPLPPATNGVGSRRSLSMESLNQPPATSPMVHELAVASSNARGSGRRPGEQKRLNQLKKTGSTGKSPNGRLPNESFRAAVDKSHPFAPKEVAVDVGKGEWVSSGSQSLPRSGREARPKSVGFFARFGLLVGDGGKKSEDSSAAGEERARKAMQEEQRRIRQQYERLRREQELAAAAGRGLYPTQPHPPHPQMAKGVPQRGSSRSQALQGSPWMARRQQPPPYPVQRPAPAARAFSPTGRGHRNGVPASVPRSGSTGSYGRVPPLPPPHAPPPPPQHYRQASGPQAFLDYEEAHWTTAANGTHRGPPRSRSGSDQRAEGTFGYGAWGEAAAHGQGSQGAGDQSRPSVGPSGPPAHSQPPLHPQPTPTPPGSHTSERPQAPPAYALHLRLSQRRGKGVRPASSVVDYAGKEGGGLREGYFVQESPLVAADRDYYMIKM